VVSAFVFGGVDFISLSAESVDSVVIVLGNVTRGKSPPSVHASDHDAAAPAVLLFEGIPVSFSCTAVGGYPPPQVNVRLGSDDITHLFDTAVNQTLLAGNGHGLRLVRYETQLWTPSYVPPADADQKLLHCSAEVTGLRVVEQHVRLNVCCKQASDLFLRAKAATAFSAF